MDLLESLNKEQRDVVLCIAGPSLVIAGPGSGKTRALTHKIAYLIRDKGVDADSVLAVTFTNKAAKEMQERVLVLLNEAGGGGVSGGVGGSLLDSKFQLGYNEASFSNAKKPSWIGTFHSLSSRILRQNAKFLEVSQSFVIYDTDDSEKLIKQILDDANMSSREISPGAILSTISRLKGEMVDPESFIPQSKKSYYFQNIANIYPEYQKRLRGNNAMDFGDLLYETVRLFKREKDVLKNYSEQFKYILIDEYQDTNRVQYELVKMLAATHKNLTVVGDISQSIYSWRGADYRNMVQFEKDYPKAKIFKLAKNYRSTKTILDASKNVIEQNRTHVPIDLYTDNPQGDKIKLYEAEQERAEAQYITDMIAFLADRGNTYEFYPEEIYKNYAVLYRTNAQSRALEEAFLNAGIPYRIIGGIRFYDRREIKDVISYLRVFMNPVDDISWSRCINTPPRGIGKKGYENLRKNGFDLKEVDKVAKAPFSKYVKMAEKGAKPVELLDGILHDFGYLDYLDDGSEESLARIENLKELRVVTAQYDSLQTFLENIALIESSNKAELKNDDSVVLMTLHSAKGLEYDTVFIAGMEEGIFPHTRSMADPDELEEERRLCYVGMTRAKKNLYMTYTRRRMFYGGTGASIISRFVAEIPEEYIEFRFS